ncbi:MAG: hypothetical protein PHI12_08970 [Dehalococcoidales bacterium]|nr:hypothetical protein [Dehalococcoidales bacterium]
MSFLGFAFEMGARDVGFEQTLGDTIKGLDSVNWLLEKQNKIAGGAAKVVDKLNAELEGQTVILGRSIGAARNAVVGEVDKINKRIEDVTVGLGHFFGRATMEMENSVVEFGRSLGAARNTVVGQAEDMAYSVGQSIGKAMVKAGEVTYKPLFKMGQAYAVLRNTAMPHIEVIGNGLGKLGEKSQQVMKLVGNELEHVASVTKDIFGKGVDAGMSLASRGIQKFSVIFKKTFGKKRDELGQFIENTDDATKSVKKLGDELDDTGKEAGGFRKKTSGAMEGLMKRVTQFNVANIAANMKTLTGETGNLTSSLEATMTGLLQTTKPVAATLNLTGKEMKAFASRAAGIAYGMNTSADTVADVMKTMHVANKGAKEAMDSLGMSTQDWVKVVSTTGVPMQDYTEILGDLTASWGAAPKDAAKFLDNMTAIGKATGTGLGPLKGAKGALDEIGGIFKSLPPTMQRSSKEIQGLMESSARLSGAFLKMGVNQEDAVTSGNAVAKMFAEQDVAITRALSIGDDRALSENPLLKYMMQLGVGFDEAREIIATGSRDSVAGVQKINELFSKMSADERTGVQRSLADFSASLGEGAKGLAFLAAGTNESTTALAAMDKLTVKGSGALNQFGKDAYSSGLTLQDTYNRAQEQFDMMVRSVARKDVRGYVKDQIAGMREAGKEIQRLGSDETWGPFVKAVSNYEQMGISGLFASFASNTKDGVKNAAAFGAKAGLVFKTLGKFGDELSPIMQMLGMFGPLGGIAAGAGIAGLFVMDDKARKSILGPFDSIIGGMKEKISGMLKGINWGELWTKFKTGVESVFNWFKKAFTGIKESGIFKDIADGLTKAFEFVVSLFPWEAILNGAARVLQKLADILAKDVDWAALGTTLVGVFKTILPSLIGMVKSMVSGLFSGMGGGEISTMATMGGAAFMLALSNPVSGIVALAGMAGLSLGEKIGKFVTDIEDKLTGQDLVSRGLEGSKKIMSDDRKSLELTVMNMPSYLDDYAKLMQDAIAEEKKAGVLQSDETIKRLEDTIKYIETIKSDVFAREQALNVQFSGSGFTEKDLYDQSIMPMEEWEGELIAANQEGALLGGQSVATQLVTGITDQLKSEDTTTQIDNAVSDATSSIIGQSPPITGPLSGEGPSSDVYMAGQAIMEQFSFGIADSMDMVRQTVEMAMDESVISALDTYAVKMRELSAKKGLLASIAEGIVADMGMKIETADPDANVDVKKSFALAMSLPGLSGVTMAVVNEAAATRKMLKAIHNELVTQTGIMSGTKPTPKGATTSGPAPVAG